MTPKKFLIAWAAWILWFVAMMSGILTAFGIVLLWNNDVWHKTLAGFQAWILIVLIPLFMVLNAAGALVIIVLPTYFIFRIPMMRKGQEIPNWLKAFTDALNQLPNDRW
jgi:hypothetical protein